MIARPRTASIFLHVAMLLVCALMINTISCSGYTPEFKSKKIKQLLAKAEHNVMSLDNTAYEVLLEKPRDYGLVVLYTAMSNEYKCGVCKLWDPEFRVAAESYAKAGKQQFPIYFSTIDFKDNRDIFMKLKLRSAPNMYYYPPTLKSLKQDKQEFKIFNVAQRQATAEELQQFITKETKQDFDIIRPMTAEKLLQYGLIAAALIASLFLFYSQVIAIIFGRKIWTLASIATVLLMTSGYMWNQIRNPPYVSINQQGHLEYVRQGFQEQVGFETQLVSILTGICSMCVLALISYAPTVKKAPAQRLLVLMIIALLMITFSITMLVFRFKSGGYPFRLLL